MSASGNEMKESLVGSNTTPLYDPVCMLDINRDLASGYLILLLGGPENSPSPQKKRRGKRDRSPASAASPRLDNDVVSLAFAALTDGNIVNACFGAPSQPSSSPAYQMARNAKTELGLAADSSDEVKRLAVQSYVAGFRVVVDYNDQVAGMSPCSRCLKEGVIRKAAELDLKAAFRTLSEAVAAAT